MTSRTDANGQVTTYTYETYNRLARENWPGGGYKSFSYNDTLFSGKYRTRVVTHVQHTAGSTVDVTLRYFDGLGRLIRTRYRKTLSSVDDLIVDRTYEICSCTGRTEKVSMPYTGADAISRAAAG